MPRGDHGYMGIKNARHLKGMPPSHNCVWVDTKSSDDEMERKWNNIFGSTTRRSEITGKSVCTCNKREEKVDGQIYIVTDNCGRHGSATRIKLKLTDIQEKFSKAHMKKVREYVMYGSGSIRDLR